jgi:hypothetical protein
LTREEFVAQLERGAAQCAGLPVSQAVLRWTGEQLKRGEPPWWKNIAKAWEKRRFVAWSEAWTLYLAALHFEALSDADSPLVAYFPSCGGTAEADPASGLARFFSDVPPSFYKNLRDRHRRTYVAARALLWVSPALLYFQRKRGLPFYLVEVNAGAGLDLAADALQPQKSFDSSLIAARIGLDPEPLDLADLEHRRWLTAGIFPDDPRSIALLDGAVEAVKKRQSDEANFLQLAPCPPEKAAAFLAKNVPADDPDVGLLVFNMGTTVRMTDAEYAAYGQSIFAALKPWGDRGLWVEAENVRGELYSSTLQLRAHRLVDGTPRSFVMASFDIEASKHAYSEASASFLEVK